ncbi:MAG: hypothetical protein KGI97_07900 [Alphaproteobacteria bacterium]|nr:hypothetical protein [Alphaproteobacteria bacterium]
MRFAVIGADIYSLLFQPMGNSDMNGKSIRFNQAQINGGVDAAVCFHKFAECLPLPNVATFMAEKKRVTPDRRLVRIDKENVSALHIGKRNVIGAFLFRQTPLQIESGAVLFGKIQQFRTQRIFAQSRLDRVEQLRIIFVFQRPEIDADFFAGCKKYSQSDTILP